MNLPKTIDTMNLIKSSDCIINFNQSAAMPLLLALGLLGLLTGCATGDKETILPQEGPTMKEVYQHHFFEGTHLTDSADPGKTNHRESQEGHANVCEDKASTSIKRYFPQSTESDLSGYTRDAYSEIQQIFPRLKNPTLVMYVFPHLSGSEKNPVPGYSTAFSLYETTEFALPGEPEEGY